MAFSSIVVPESGFEATRIWLAKWHFPDGTTVSKDVVVATIETPEMTCDIEAHMSGTIRHLVKEMAELRFGESIATIEDDKAFPTGPVSIELSEIELAKVDQLRGKKSRDHFITQLVRKVLR